MRGFAWRGSARRDLEPTMVFTPDVPVTPDRFTARDEDGAQDATQLALATPGRHLLLFGPTGAGKTSLLNFVAAEQKLRVLYEVCFGPFESVVSQALLDLDARKE